MHCVPRAVPPWLSSTLPDLTKGLYTGGRAKRVIGFPAAPSVVMDSGSANKPCPQCSTVYTFHVSYNTASSTPVPVQFQSQIVHPPMVTFHLKRVELPGRDSIIVWMGICARCKSYMWACPAMDLMESDFLMHQNQEALSNQRIRDVTDNSGSDLLDQLGWYSGTGMDVKIGQTIDTVEM